MHATGTYCVADLCSVFEAEANGEIAQVVVDECSLDFLKGSTIHFETTIMRTAFAVINNPNVELGCGCGVSFAPK